MVIANTCVILHNIIVHMYQEGCFEDEADSVNLITDFVEGDDQERLEMVI